MRLLLFIGAVVALVATYRPSWLGTGPLDGTAWEVSVRRDSFLSWPRRDTLLFDRGRLTALGYSGRGVSPGDYRSEALGRSSDSVWRATTPSSDGPMEWEGRVQGDRISGTVLWQDRKGRSRRLRFKGRRRA